MPDSILDTIYPCPFSKGYGIPARQAWLLIKVFLIYRWLIGCLFIILFHSRISPNLLGVYDARLYLQCWLIYLGLTVLSWLNLRWHALNYVAQAQSLIFTDIALLTLIMHSCGGIASGLGILLAVSVAVSGLAIGGRCAMLFAALASIAILSEQIYADVEGLFQTSSYTYTGMTGASFMAIALVSHLLAKRSEQILLLADLQKQTISDLEGLNQYIIHHLQSGIIIVAQNQNIQMVNDTLLRLVNLPFPPDRLGDIGNEVTEAFEQWLADSDQDFAVLQLNGQSDVQIRFMHLPTSQECYYMLIVEDVLLYNQRLQQSKLASLGRLTASIAHEIRNPLGAVSHAGQLLSENMQLTSQDRRLVEIIKVNSNRVNQIIEDILRLSKRTPSHREKISLYPWLDQYLKNFSLEHGIRDETFKLNFTDASLQAWMDPGHLKQILDNLCQNALKYGCPETSPFLLQCHKNLNTPCIELLDHGPEIKQEHVKHLFEPFFTTSSSGTGLGLFISRELAELNQAKLTYCLTKNRKNCFRLMLQDAEHTQIEI